MHALTSDVSKRLASVALIAPINLKHKELGGGGARYGWPFQWKSHCELILFSFCIQAGMKKKQAE